MEHEPRPLGIQYELQVFRHDVWENTDWGGNDYQAAQETAYKIVAHNTMDITKVRILKVIAEFDCDK